MLKSWVAAALVVAASAAASAAPAAKPAPIEVMVLGTYHFANPGRDINNVKVDDVLAPRRQRELEAVAAAIARFRPTKVMIEREVDAPGLVDSRYAAFRAADLLQDRNERVQLGYRIAKAVGLAQVHGIDEFGAPDEPDYFPYGAVVDYAKTNGQDARLAEIAAAGPAAVARFERMQPTMSIAGLLADVNDPKNPQVDMSFYYRVLGIGDRNAQPGADLNARWYLRNAKIFGKLMSVARPGDRLLVVYGAGHGYWLRHFARETPGYRDVDPRPLLKAAAPR